MVYSNIIVILRLSFPMSGLLALTLGCGDRAQEILEESIPVLSLALKSGADSSKISSVQL